MTAPARKPKRWLLIGAAIAATIILATVVYLAKPLPPPKVSIAFEKFTTLKTNVYAVIRLTNEGQTRIYWNGIDWDLEAQTAGGWTTSSPPHLTWLPYAVFPGSNHAFAVHVPEDVLQWRVTVTFSYYHRHHVRYEFVDELIQSGVSGKPAALYDTVARCLRLLPEPRENYEDASTPWLTNSPPPADTTTP